MVLRLLSLALAWLVLCNAPQATGHSELLAADAAPQAELQEAGGAHPLDPAHAQGHGEGAGDSQELLRTHPAEPPVLLARDRHGPFVEAMRRAPYLDGLQRPPCLTRITA